MIVVVDYGVGNLASILNMLRKAGVPARIGRTAEELRSGTHLILPGVGAFDTGVRNLTDRGLVPVLEELALADRRPFLGICLGMQLMARGSDEGDAAGLGWFAARCVRFTFPTEPARKVPHMGWNAVAPTDASGGLLPPDNRFYFVHAYHLRCDDPADVAGTTTYGYTFPSAIRRGNLHGVQFHPEKSHRFGLALLRRFWEGTA